MMREWRYPLALSVTLVILAGGALVAFHALAPVVPRPTPNAGGTPSAQVTLGAQSALDTATTPVSLTPARDTASVLETSAQPVQRSLAAAPPVQQPVQTPAPVVAVVRDTSYTAAVVSSPPRAEQPLRDALLAVTRAAGEAASAGDSVNAARLWGRAVELAPNDMMLRRLHAEALSWSGDTNRALAIYDALLEETPESTLLLRARAAVKVRSGDNSGALADLQAAEERAPTAGGQVLLGDIHRWLGDRSESRRAYDRALAVDRMVAGAQDGLDELARTAVRDLPWDIDEGTITTWSAIDDNTGFQTGVLRMQHGTPLGLERRTILLAAAELREVQRDVTRVIGPRSVDIRGGDLGVAHRFGDLRTTARMGATSFSNASEIITWSAGLEWNPGTTMFSGSLSRRPAFETLRAGATLTNGGALSAVSAATTFSRRLGATSELWASGELVALSDQNQRSSVQLGLRRDIARGLSLFYAGGWLGFEDAAASYWSPRSYSLQGLGLEYRGAWRSGAYVRAQALDGFAWFSQDLPGGGVERGRAGQWQLSGETGWRRPRWEITLASALGREREGSYQASTGLLRLRYRW